MVVDGLHSTRPIEFEVVSPDDAERHVRRPDLREGRQRPAHARAVPRRRGLPRRHPPLPDARTPTPTPSPPTCGTRSRRPRASRSREHHGHLDPPGRPPPRPRRRRARRPAALLLRPARPVRRPSARRGRSPCSPDRSAATAVEAAILVAEPRSPSSRAPCSTPGGWGTYRTAYGPDAELAPDRRGHRRRSAPLERFSLVADTWAAVQAGQSELPG